MEKLSSRFALLKEKAKNISAKVSELKKESQKLKEKNEELVSKMAIIEEENKMARKFVKERDLIKSRIENIIENIERGKI